VSAGRKERRIFAPPSIEAGGNALSARSNEAGTHPPVNTGISTVSFVRATLSARRQMTGSLHFDVIFGPPLSFRGHRRPLNASGSRGLATACRTLLTTKQKLQAAKAKNGAWIPPRFLLRSNKATSYECRAMRYRDRSIARRDHYRVHRSKRPPARMSIGTLIILRTSKSSALPLSQRASL
jgi:hypothetical protein